MFLTIYFALGLLFAVINFGGHLAQNAPIRDTLIGLVVNTAAWPLMLIVAAYLRVKQI